MMALHFLNHYRCFVVLALHVIAIVTVMKLQVLRKPQTNERNFAETQTQVLRFDGRFKSERPTNGAACQSKILIYDVRRNLSGIHEARVPRAFTECGPDTIRSCRRPPPAG